MVPVLKALCVVGRSPYFFPRNIYSLTQKSHFSRLRTDSLSNSKCWVIKRERSSQSHKLFNVINHNYRFFTTSIFKLSSHSTPVQSLPKVATTKMDAKAMSQYIIPLDQPVVNLDCKVAFENLTKEEKLYAHHLSLASWQGGLITLVQTSPESPVIFCLLHKMFKTVGVDGLKELAVKKCGFTEDEWKALEVYTCGVLANMGNYKGFGDTKIIPGVPMDKLENLVMATIVDDAKLWNAVKDKMYSLEEKDKQLGLGDKGITTYFSSNCVKEDAELINRFMKSKHMEGYNTRVFKTVDGGTDNFEIRLAGIQKKTLETHDFEGAKVTITSGDYSPLLEAVNQELAKAVPFASNDLQKQMLKCYIESFETGSLDAHKQGSRHWIKDKGPAIETYIGFIETYRDPTGVRGEFESFVSIVNRPMSLKFSSLVDNAQTFLKLLPWPKDFERDVFMKPDFTSLDVLTFSGSGIPAGINIPNYDEIRQHEGFKNVSLGNVIPASYKQTKLSFMSEKDKELFLKYFVSSFEVQVGLHELLGHGSGKALKKDNDGKLNFPEDLKNPLTGEPVESFYQPGETYDSVFTTMGSAYEECRAECVGLLLSVDSHVLKIFGHEGEEAETIKYVNWLCMIYAAVKSLEMYHPTASVWKQAHAHARFAILQVLLEAGEDFVKIEQVTGTDGKPDLQISLDKTKIDTVGHEAIRKFLLKLQVYKSTADIASARKLFGGYTDVNNDGKHPWASWREIVMDKKQPRKMFVQSNTTLNANEDVELKCYEGSPASLIQSWVDRFDTSVYAPLIHCWEKDKPFF